MERQEAAELSGLFQLHDPRVCGLSNQKDLAYPSAWVSRSSDCT